MSRWQPGSRERLRSAALELFTENGYAATTAAAVAERVGVTERTFYRHFKDKREVLFDDGERLERVLLDALRAEPPTLRAEPPDRRPPAPARPSAARCAPSPTTWSRAATCSRGARP
ncbi:TetR/AcrR family transcriptional regulator [Streptomyces sp. M19]